MDSRLSFAFTLLVAQGAIAGPRLYVLDLASPPELAALASQVSQSVQQHAQQAGFELDPSEQVRAAVGDKDFESAIACSEKAGCVARHLAKLGNEQVVLGTLARDEENYLLRLYWVDLAKAERLASIERVIPIASRRLEKELAEALPRFFRAEVEAVGVLELTSNVDGALLWVDDVASGKLPKRLTLKTGQHRVRVEKARYLTVERIFTLEPRQRVSEKLLLLLEPGQRAPEDDPSVEVVSSEAQSRGFFQHPWPVWVAAGAAAGALGVGIGLAVDAPSHAPPFGLRQQQAANVCFGVAAAAALTSVALALFLPPGDRVALSVFSGSQSAAASAGFRF